MTWAYLPEVRNIHERDEAATGAHAHAPFANQAGDAVASTTPSTRLIPTDNGASTDGAPAHRPDRVLVRLKPAIASRVRLQSGTTSPGALLGTPSLDAIGVQVRAISAVPAIETPQNSSEASHLGLHDWVIISLAPGSDVQAT